MTESQNIEYKSSWHDDHLKWICGFANATGGTLFIGIKDDGSVSGVTNFKYLMEEIPSKTRNLMGITVTVNLKNLKGLNYLEIITPFYSVPISLRGRYYFRSGSTNTELTGSSLNEFLMRKFGKTWDDVTEESFKVDELNFQTIETFKKLAIDRITGISSENDPLVLLNKLNLIQNGQFKRAAILLFGINPQKYFIQSHIKIGKFISDVDIATTDIVAGNLFQQIEQTLTILKTKYLLSPISYEGIHRREKLEYPYLALREAILNAIIHRNYLTTSAIQIRIYQNKLIIMNEGILPDEIKIEDLKSNHLSKPRNTLLADVFYKSGFIESWGRGTLKIVAECLNENLPEPEFENKGHLFSVTFLKADLKADLKTDLKTLTIEDKILSLIRENNRITTHQISLGISKGITITKEYIKKLKAGEKIKRIGPARGGYWEVIEKTKDKRQK